MSSKGGRWVCRGSGATSDLGVMDAGADGGSDTVSIAFRFALRDQRWELPRSILRLNPFSAIRGARRELARLRLEVPDKSLDTMAKRV